MITNKEIKVRNDLPGLPREVEGSGEFLYESGTAEFMQQTLHSINSLMRLCINPIVVSYLQDVESELKDILYKSQKFKSMFKWQYIKYTDANAFTEKHHPADFLKDAIAHAGILVEVCQKRLSDPETSHNFYSRKMNEVSTLVKKHSCRTVLKENTCDLIRQSLMAVVKYDKANVELVKELQKKYRREEIFLRNIIKE